MTRMRQLMLMVTGVAVLSGTPLLAGAADYEGVVALDSIEARPGDHFGVKVWLRNNDINVSAMTIPLQWDSPYLELDSVSFNGTVWGSEFAFYTRHLPDSQTVQVTILPAELQSPVPYVVFSEGTVAELFFTLAYNAQSQFVTIDSVYADTMLGGTHVMTQIDISDNTGFDIYLPGFVPGGVEVLVPTGIKEESHGIVLPEEFDLGQNYPNPFNPVTTIGFSLPRPSEVSLHVFNILGQEVASLTDDYMEAGVHELEFDAAHLPSGIYFYRLIYDQGTLTRKMALLK